MSKKSKKSGSKFKGKVANNAKQREKTSSKMQYLKLPKGFSLFNEMDCFDKEDKKKTASVKLDFLPYIVSDKNHPDKDEANDIAVKGEQWYKRPYKTHRIGNETVICPTSIGKKCPICEYKEKQLKKGADWDDVKEYKPSERSLYVIKEAKKKSEIQLWGMSCFCFQDKLDEEVKEDEDYETFPDLEEGKTLKIRFKSESMGKGSGAYAKTTRIDFEERRSSFDEAILEEVPDLDEVILNSALPYKDIEKMFLEVEDDDDEDDDDDKKSKKKKVNKKSKKKNKDEDDDEEDDDEEDDEEDDDDEDDDEDDDDDEDEDEEEEKKSRKKKKINKKTKDDEDDEDDEEADDENDGKKQKSKNKSKVEKGKKGKCPHGHKFGKDCEEYDECDGCKKWEECVEVQEEQ